MTDKTELAKVAYFAYGQTTNFKNFEGNSMPTWDELPNDIKKAWEAASFAVSMVVEAKLRREREE